MSRVKGPFTALHAAAEAVGVAGVVGAVVGDCGCAQRAKKWDDKVNKIVQHAKAAVGPFPRYELEVGKPMSLVIEGSVVAGGIPPGLIHVGGILRGTPTEMGEFSVTLSLPPVRYSVKLVCR